MRATRGLLTWFYLSMDKPVSKHWNKLILTEKHLSLSPPPYLCRKSHCGGRVTWWGRACPIRQPSPLRGSRARPPRRALWSRLRGRRAGRWPQTSSLRPLDSEVTVNYTTPGEAAVLLVAAAGEGRKKGDRHAVIHAVCEQWNSLHEAFEAASGCWSCPSIMHFSFL